MRLIDYQRRVRALARIFPLATAMRLTLPIGRHAVISALLKPTSSVVHFRTQTSDLACMEKVFLHQEYAIPFSTAPLTIVDAGANIGAAALYFANMYPAADVIAVEPELSNFELLRRNCAGFHRIKPIRAALWHECCELQLVDPQAEKWAFSFMPIGSGSGAIINAISVDRIINQFGIDYIDVLKIDIEGAEREIFHTGNRSWLDRVGIIAVELHDRYKNGCAESFYSALYGRKFHQEIRGETIFVDIRHHGR